MSRFDVTLLPENMRAKIMVSVDQRLTNGAVCWEWIGAKNSRGYGSVTAGVKGKTMLAHRRAYMELVGQIPSGLQIDHLCMNKACVNPAHLEPVTPLENTRRASALRTHCKHGHPFEGENLRVQVRRNGWRSRICVTCARKTGSAAERRARAAGRRAAGKVAA